MNHIDRFFYFIIILFIGVSLTPYMSYILKINLVLMLSLNRMITYLSLKNMRKHITHNHHHQSF